MKFDHFYSYFYALKKLKQKSGRLENGGWVVNSDLNLSYSHLYFLPIIKKVYGYFFCDFNNLITLNGSPKIVYGGFRCDLNYLTTLQGAPQLVNGDFCCNSNKLKTLLWLPQQINGNVKLSKNPIEDYSELNKVKILGRVIK